ncbi:MAG: hypothetical protein IID28_11420 [Planctomycetes bacterium]|nr:hypothetical protein [Planctomycetota bacterium]
MTALVTVLCLVGYLLGYFVYARWWHDGVAVLFVVGSMLLVLAVWLVVEAAVAYQSERVARSSESSRRRGRP